MLNALAGGEATSSAAIGYITIGEIAVAQLRKPPMLVPTAPSPQERFILADWWSLEVDAQPPELGAAPGTRHTADSITGRHHRCGRREEQGTHV